MAIKQKNNSLPFFKVGSTPRKKMYLGSNLVYNLDAPAPLVTYISALGGIVTYDGNYKIHTFLTPGSSSFTVSSISNTPAYNDVELLVVAGGGGGGGDTAGGGGAGGLVYNSGFTVSAQTYTTVVGAGGAQQANGSNSDFGSTSAVGGGYGGYWGVGGIPSAGGSGGGAGSRNDGTSNAGGAGTSGQGNSGGIGGTGTGNNYSGGGGGGAGAAGGGSGATQLGGNGGVGLQYDISGTPKYYAGGGGGGSYNAGPSSGGNGGGGAGGSYSTPPINGTAGTANTGGGGGGGAAGGGASGGAGGSGIIVVKYLTAGPVIDTDVSTWAASSGATDTNLLVALSTFVTTLKDNSIWSKMDVIYPFASDSNTSSTAKNIFKYNLVNPATFLGSYYNSNGTGGYIGYNPQGSDTFNTGYTPSANLPANYHIAYYTSTQAQSADVIDFGVYDGGSGYVYGVVGRNAGGGNAENFGAAASSNFAPGASATTGVGSTDGFFMLATTGTTSYWYRDTTQTTGTYNSGNARGGTNPIGVGSFFNSSVPVNPVTKNIQFFSMGDYLDSTEEAILRNAVVDLQKNLDYLYSTTRSV